MTDSQRGARPTSPTGPLDPGEAAVRDASPGAGSQRFEHWPAAWADRPGGQPERGTRGMVASTDLYASRIGVEVLREGGNAVDAAVAVAFGLAVVNPEAGSIGGSGFILARTPEGELFALDYRGIAPAAATPAMFVDEGGALTGASELGHLAVAVPGAVRGLWDAHARLGSLAWARLVEPAIALARGFGIGHRLVRSYPPHIVRALERFPDSARVFLPGGSVPADGAVFRQSDLAGTLARIRDGGADGFYRGETADLLAGEMRRGGGILTQEDLAAYTTAWREPVRFGYRGRTILSMPPSSSGGITLAAAAHILAARPVGELPWHGAAHVHLLAEAWRRAYADRNHYLADPDHVVIPVETLSSPVYAAWRAEGMSLVAATRSADVGPGVARYLAGRGGPAAPPPREGTHTTHVSVVDAQGGAVSLTTTLNTWYGSKVVARGTGVLLNNEMDDFTAKPGAANHFGLVQGEANAIAPGKRMLSAMTPTLVLGPGGTLEMVLGTPGGATIITSVLQVISNVVDHGMTLAEAVAAPRVHHQHLPDCIRVEPGGLPDAVAEELRAMGHEVVEETEAWGDVQAVGVRADGSLDGVADPRRGGVAVGL